MVIGKAYKEKSISLLFLYFFLLIASIAGIALIALFLEKLSLKIVLIIVISLLILIISNIPYGIYKCKKSPDEIIKYNEIGEMLIINTYKDQYKIKLSDINFIRVHNTSAKYFSTNRIDDGTLAFYLKDGKKIKTPLVDNVYDVYNKLDELIFNNDISREDNIQATSTSGLNGWGAKKEYPSIVSVLVSLFIPFFGLYFVYNQSELKGMKNGKKTGLMGVAALISSLWFIAIVLVVALI